MATLVAVSRTEAPDGYHHGWGVLAGAAIGISSTYLFTKPYFKEHMDLGLAAGKDHYVLTFKYILNLNIQYIEINNALSPYGRVIAIFIAKFHH